MLPHSCHVRPWSRLPISPVQLLLPATPPALGPERQNPPLPPRVGPDHRELVRQHPRRRLRALPLAPPGQVRQEHDRPRPRPAEVRGRHCEDVAAGRVPILAARDRAVVVASRVEHPELVTLIHVQHRPPHRLPLPRRYRPRVLELSARVLRDGEPDLLAVDALIIVRGLPRREHPGPQRPVGLQRHHVGVLGLPVRDPTRGSGRHSILAAREDRAPRPLAHRPPQVRVRPHWLPPRLADRPLPGRLPQLLVDHGRCGSDAVVAAAGRVRGPRRPLRPGGGHPAAPGAEDVKAGEAVEAIGVEEDERLPAHDPQAGDNRQLERPAPAPPAPGPPGLAGPERGPPLRRQQAEGPRGHLLPRPGPLPGPSTGRVWRHPAPCSLRGAASPPEPLRAAPRAVGCLSARPMAGRATWRGATSWRGLGTEEWRVYVTGGV